MTTIVLRPGLTWETIPVATVHHLIDRDELLKSFEAFKAEWAEATGGELGEVTINLSMFFDDLETVIKGGKVYGQ